MYSEDALFTTNCTVRVPEKQLLNFDIVGKSFSATPLTFLEIENHSEMRTILSSMDVLRSRSILRLE